MGEEAEVKRLKARIADLEAGIESITDHASKTLGRVQTAVDAAQPVMGAVATWYAAQLHAPADQRLRAHMALMGAAEHYAEYAEGLGSAP